jgi:hypothetical protein
MIAIVVATEPLSCHLQTSEDCSIVYRGPRGQTKLDLSQLKSSFLFSFFKWNVVQNIGFQFRPTHDVASVDDECLSGHHQSQTQTDKKDAICAALSSLPTPPPELRYILVVATLYSHS